MARGMPDRRSPQVFASWSLIAWALAGALARTASAQQPPDLTAGGEIPEAATHDWTLGATGARGWMHCEKLVTSNARQVAVTEVAEGSPAAKVLRVGDVLLGVDGERFQGDPRVEIGRALTRAESKSGRGRLQLTCWRRGRTRTVTLRLPVLGDYSATAPFDCKKSDAVFERGCRALFERMKKPSYRPHPIPRVLNAMALLASGERRYLSVVRKEAEWASEFTVESFRTWYYGYLMIFVAEYVLATGDDSLKPALRRLALAAAEGQSIVGSWGHDFARPDGLLYGYGMMNAPGLPLTIGLVLARAKPASMPRKSMRRSTRARSCCASTSERVRFRTETTTRGSRRTRTTASAEWPQCCSTCSARPRRHRTSRA